MENVTKINTSDKTDLSCFPKDAYVYVHLVFLYVIFPIVVIGMILNCIVFFVFAQFDNKQTYVFLLRALAVIDMLFLASAGLVLSIKHILNRILRLQPKSLYVIEDTNVRPVSIFYYGTPIFFFFITMRNWCVVLTALDRLIHIALPLWAKQNMTRSVWEVTMVFVALFGLLPSVPFFFIFEFKKWIDPCTGELEDNIGAKTDKNVADKIHNYSYIGLVMFIPVSLLIIINIGLIWALYRAKVQQAKLNAAQATSASNRNNKSKREQKRALLMVFALTVIYLTFECPGILDRILILRGVSDTHPLISYLRKASLICVCMDSLANFFGYLVTNRMFRNALVNCVCIAGDRRRRDSLH